jgi:regulator of sigma E protease
VKAVGAILGNMLTGRAKASENVGGPVAIVQQAGAFADAGVFAYMRFIGMISVSLGIINLLPVPVLDGGNITISLIEAIRGRALSLEIRERIQMIGVLGLVVLMLLVTVNDVGRWVAGP